MIIKQKLYGRIEIDNKEPDMVAIWNMGTLKVNNEINVVHVERKNINKLITALQQCQYVHSLRPKNK